MNEPEPTRPLGATVADVPPEVTRFVTKVRQQLSDLEPETQDELVDGLVADLADRVAEDGPGALGDPRAYAGELRAAAGLAPRPRVRVPKMRARGTALQGIGPRLDAARAAWDRLLARQSVLTPGLLETLRPVWWVLRAWVLVQTFDALFGGYPMGLIPSIQGPVVGGLIFLVAALASVQIGRGLVWPGTSRETGPRVVLLVGNLVAIAFLPAVLGWLQNGYGTSFYESGGGYAEAVPAGLSNDGSPVYNVFAYDAQGRPLTGVQLFDQDGRKLSAEREEYSWIDPDGNWIKTFPWQNGFAPLWNVYPRPQQTFSEEDGSAVGSDTPQLPDPPMAQVPPAALPSTVPTPTPAPTSTPSVSPSPTPSPAASSTPSPSPRS